MAVIYKIVNLITEQIYVGSALNFEKRKYLHLYHLRKKTHHSHILQASYNKHGIENFEFIIIEEVEDISTLLTREQYWMDTLNPKYNHCRKAGSPIGVKHTAKSRANMSKAHKGIKPTPEAIVKRTLKQTGLKRTEETKRNIKLSLSKKPIIQCDLEGNPIKEWISQGEAARQLGLQRSRIGDCCNKKYGRKTCGGFTWKFKN